ncbi:MAG: FAD-dependent oxidoreductase [Candidatus Micrarchaeota archaeon]
MRVKSDVLIIGTGGAGLRAAIELHDSGADVLVLGKCEKGKAHTIQATGGINAALGTMDPEDTWQLHAADTIRDGDFINDPKAVEILCRNAPKAVEELQKWGCPFAKDKSGKIVQRFFGAATYRRACFVGDYTGKAILDTLVRQVEKRKIRFLEKIYIFSLLTSGKKVNGAMGLAIKSGKIVVFHAKKVILATGGHSRMFSRCSSHFWESNGDGISLAYHLGAKFMDMEMFQFHPTGMVWPHEAEGLLVTESVRGEGGILTNAKGERFMKRYDPERMELSARDIVARAIFFEIKAGRGTKKGAVYLDISHKPKKYIMERLPKMYRQLKKYNKIDITKNKMEVAPTAHYSMGGLLVDNKTGKTGIRNLFAVGEVTSGVHGGNRLGGNSLAEIMVFGRLAGQSVAKELKRSSWLPLDTEQITQKEDELLSMLSAEGEDPVQAKKDIQKMMMENAGVIREEGGMRAALEMLDFFGEMQLKTGKSLKNNPALSAALDIRNMLPTCRMILLSAMERKESRGAHYRSDLPGPSGEWLKNIICQPGRKGIKIIKRKVPPASFGVRLLLKKKAEPHLLE